MKASLFIFLCFISTIAVAQDTLVFRNNDKVLGEVKSLTNAVLQIETPYSDSDFNVDWLQVKKITTTTMFMIITTDGERFTGYLKTDPVNEQNIIITLQEGGTQTLPHLDIVSLQSVNEKFWDRVSLLVDGGYSITKANDVEQLTFNAVAGYSAERFSVNLNYNSLFGSTLDSIKPFGPIMDFSLSITYTKVFFFLRPRIG